MILTRQLTNEQFEEAADFAAEEMKARYNMTVPLAQYYSDESEKDNDSKVTHGD